MIKVTVEIGYAEGGEITIEEYDAIGVFSRAGIEHRITALSDEAVAKAIAAHNAHRDAE